MKAKDIHELLLSCPDPLEARAVAMQFLEDTSRDGEGFVHIVDPANGKWQSSFKTENAKYKIISPSDGMSLRRYTKLRAALSVVGSDATFSEQIQNVKKAMSLIDQIATQKTGIVELSVVLENMKQAIARTDRNWHYSAYAATLFIVREDEDIRDYSEEIAEQKIEDWNKANINASDFFFCCWLWEKRWNERLTDFAVRLM